MSRRQPRSRVRTIYVRGTRLTLHFVPNLGGPVAVLYGYVAFVVDTGDEISNLALIRRLTDGVSFAGLPCNIRICDFSD